MGIIANVKQKLANIASDKMTNAAALSPKQLADIEEKRLAYLAQDGITLYQSLLIPEWHPRSGAYR